MQKLIIDKLYFINLDEMLAVPAVEISDLGQIPSAPLVSVIIVTYNHEAYIVQAIESVLAQEVDFPLELIIGEDRSIDRTLDICLEYQRRHPQLIRVVTWKENLGISANYLRVLGRARGKFIAPLEGDDYWIDPAKLTKQVALMARYPDTTLCGARTRIMSEIPGKEPGVTVIGPERPVGTYSLKEVLSTYLCHTSSFLLRNSETLVTRHFWDIVYPDGYFQCLHAYTGCIRCLPEVVSVWRHHPRGLCIGGPIAQHLERCEAICAFLLDIVKGSDRKLVNNTLDIIASRKCHNLLNEGRTEEAWELARDLLPRLARHDLPRALQLLAHGGFPKLYDRLRRLTQDSNFGRYIKEILQ